MKEKKSRLVRDSMGELEVKDGALWGAQTQRAVNNFPVSGITMPRGFIRALGLIKWASAGANGELGLLSSEFAMAIQRSAESVQAGDLDAHFPIDVFQTGSGTSSNMNANEVIANVSSNELGKDIHPNDHVNMCQSSNDVIPSCINIAAALKIKNKLKPSLIHLSEVLEQKIESDGHIIKTGRTHLMDAMPVSFAQELGAWHSQIQQNIERLDNVFPKLCELAQGGTAVGTGINAHPKFGVKVCQLLQEKTDIPFTQAGSLFAALSSQDVSVELSGQLRVLAVSLTKISNDLRWMNSGPMAGISEIELPSLQPGSSIMPGKVNPVIPESVAMVAANVIGNDASIALAGQTGNFQLNVMLPLVAYKLLDSLDVISNAARLLADSAISGFEINEEVINEVIARNPILVTALNPVIGYEKSAQIAKKAYQEGRPILEVAKEETDLSVSELEEILDPRKLVDGGLGG